MSKRICFLLSVSIALLPAAFGCSIPTEAPEWESRWVVPGDETTISVGELLPDGVTVAPSGTDFDVDVDPFTFAQSLGDACPSCSALQGMTVPKPAFTVSLEGVQNFPADVVSVNVTSSQVEVRATNGFTFDPIQPGMGNTGTMTIRIYDGPVGGTLLDQIVVDGAVESFPPAASRSWMLAVSGPVGSTISTEVIIDSPAGDPVTVDVATAVDVLVTPQEILVGSVVVDIGSKDVTIDPVSLDLEDIEEDLVDKVESGAFELVIANAFGVAIDAVLDISGPSTSILKPVTIPATPVATVRVDFTQEELQSILGQPNVTLSGTGMVAPGTGNVTITPDQTLDIDTKIDVNVTLGG